MAAQSKRAKGSPKGPAKGHRKPGSLRAAGTQYAPRKARYADRMTARPTGKPIDWSKR
jgi:hypothetical protein